MGQGDRGGHQFWCLITGEAEHHALVARADRLNLIIAHCTSARLKGLIDALRNVRRLAVDSDQHAAEVSQDQIREDMIEDVMRAEIPAEWIDEQTKYFINPTGRFVVGGPMGDSGLTGRKIIVDTYGGVARHGGGAFSGKDPSKVDRSAAYAARWVAKNVVAAGLAERCELQVSYAIGVARPLSLSVETFGTGTIADERIIKAINEVFDLRPGAIIRDLDLRRPIYNQTAAGGHFGRTDIDLPWEQTNRVDALRSAAGL